MKNLKTIKNDLLPQKYELKEEKRIENTTKKQLYYLIQLLKDEKKFFSAR